VGGTGVAVGGGGWVSVGAETVDAGVDDGETGVLTEVGSGRLVAVGWKVGAGVWVGTGVIGGCVPVGEGNAGKVADAVGEEDGSMVAVDVARACVAACVPVGVDVTGPSAVAVAARVAAKVAGVGVADKAIEVDPGSGVVVGTGVSSPAVSVSTAPGASVPPCSLIACSSRLIWTAGSGWPRGSAE